MITDLEKVEIELLLEAIYRFYGIDFRNYLLPTLRRRIGHRINLENLKNITQLQERVLHDRTMLDILIDDLTINVTEMYRDPSFFKTFRHKVIPKLKNRKQIRIWHAGCSSGEESFSMAILLHEEGLLEKTKIYSTDLNEWVLNQAKTGIFQIEKMQQYTRNYLKAGGTRAFCEYYTVQDSIVKFHSFLSKNMIFDQHNLAVDHSFNEFDVIICRNVMIYFNGHLQNRVHHLFYESLHTNGFLGLGNKEDIAFTSYSDCYEEIDSNDKLYIKIK